MVITCPSCNRSFNLTRKAPELFKCPKCGYSTPFTNILEASHSAAPGTKINVPGDGMASSPTQATSGAATQIAVGQNSEEQKTRVVAGLQGEGDQKTQVVASLQQVPAVLQVMANRSIVKVLPLRPGQHTLGRLSSDSTATIKIAPDISMSRIHALMQTVKGPDGSMQFAIKPAKTSNPVYVNNKPIAQGTAAILRSGDVIIMGQTTVVFQRK